MAHHLKYKRFTVNVPLHLAKAILQRIPEVGYGSESSYFVGLALYDLWSRREHRLTVKVMNEPPPIRDGSIDRIATDYLEGKTGRTDASFFERYIAEIIAAEVSKVAQADAATPEEDQPCPDLAKDTAAPTALKEGAEITAKAKRKIRKTSEKKAIQAETPKATKKPPKRKKAPEGGAA